MGTLIWLVITTAIGWAIGKYVPEVPAPILGAVTGFVVGVVLRVLVATGSGAAGSIDDVIDIFD